MPQRLEHLEVLKGISIILIVAFHIRGEIFHAQPLWFLKLTYQGVHAFFLVSGLGLAYSLLNRETTAMPPRFWLSWFRRRLVRIIPLYWMVLFLSILVYIFKFKFLLVGTGTSSMLKDVFLHAFMLHIFIPEAYFSINIAWWFVGVIFYFYLIFPLLFTLLYRLRSTKLIFIFLPALVVAAFYLLPIKSQVTISFLFFTAGASLAFWVDKIRDLKIFQSLKFQLFFIALFFLISLSGVLIMVRPYVYKDTAFSLPYDVGYLLLSLFSVALIYSLSMGIVFAGRFRPLEYPGKILAWIGLYSYAIFLVHWGFIRPIFLRFDNFGVALLSYSALVIFLSVILTALSPVNGGGFRRSLSRAH